MSSGTVEVGVEVWQGKGLIDIDGGVSVQSFGSSSAVPLAPRANLLGSMRITVLVPIAMD